MKFTNRLWPIRHGHFQEMCALAVTGQLGGAQMCELDEHIAECEPCRKYLESIAQVSVQAMSLLAEKQGPTTKVLPPQGIRERFLERLTSESTGAENGTALRLFPMPALKPYPVLPEPGVFKIVAVRKPSPTLISTMIFSSVFWRSLLVAAGCLVIASAAYYAGAHRATLTHTRLTGEHPVVLMTSPAPPAITLQAVDSSQVDELEREKSELETRLVGIKQALSAAESERESLSKQLAAAKEKLETPRTQSANDSQAFSVTAQQAGTPVASLQAQVDRLNQRLAEAQVKLETQKQTSDELAARLDATSADLQRELDLKSAKSELGELVAARNLHIVDVYDADGNGKRQQSFGRVFYIEGRSLVFYAYDLDDSSRFKTNVVFHVWGGKAGLKDVTHSLGILHKDESGKNRWAMTFDDPSVLAQINSIFVTVESTNKRYDEPHGKKVLYAYFGSPANHP